MKKLLSLIGTVSIIGAGVNTVISCNDNSSVDQQTANDIKNKITNPNLTVPAGTNPNITNPATIQAIKTALHGKNKTLKSDDLAKISFTGKNLQAGSPVAVTATITVGSATATKDLKVTLAETDKQKADAIKSKIITTALNLPVGTSTNVSQDKQPLDKALQGANPALTTQDLATITYSGSTLIPGTAVNVKATITVVAATDTVDLSVTLDKKTPPPPSGKVLSGYWYGWNNPVAISDINPLYNLIDIAFYNTPSSSSSLPALNPNIINNKVAVKAGIKKQQAAGHKVVLSLGGALDFTAINAGNVKQFESNTLKIMNDYGFNGIDIDLEGGPARDQGNAQYIPEALKYLKTELGSNFIITAAPEFPNLRGGSDPSIYPALIKSLGNDLTYLQPQIYNQGRDGINVSSSDQTKFHLPSSYLAESNTQFHAQFLYLIMKYLSTADPSDPNFAVKVDPAKLLIGLPATKLAASTGYTEPAVVQQAYKIFQQQKLNISGLMTWAVNYDHNDNWQFALESYGKTWGS